MAGARDDDTGNPPRPAETGTRHSGLGAAQRQHALGQLPAGFGRIVPVDSDCPGQLRRGIDLAHQSQPQAPGPTPLRVDSRCHRQQHCPRLCHRGLRRGGSRLSCLASPDALFGDSWCDLCRRPGGLLTRRNAIQVVLARAANACARKEPAHGHYRLAAALRHAASGRNAA